VVVGVLMWNVFNKVSVARKIIREHRHYDDLAEVAKLFRIHDKLVSILKNFVTDAPEK